jgi:hypothetical protein
MTPREKVQRLIAVMKDQALKHGDEAQFLEWCSIERGWDKDQIQPMSKEDREALMISDPLEDERMEVRLWVAPKKTQKI